MKVGHIYGVDKHEFEEADLEIDGTTHKLPDQLPQTHKIVPSRASQIASFLQLKAVHVSHERKKI